jgi:hypothetical protein
VVAALLAGAVAGCSSGADLTGSLDQRMSAWISAAGLSASYATIASDLSKVDKAWSRRDLLSLKTECGLLRGDVANAFGVLPTPDSQLTGQLGRVYEALGTAATKCIDGSGRGSSGTIRAALDGLTNADHGLRQATARAHALAGTAEGQG